MLVKLRSQFHQHLCATFSLANFDAFFAKWQLANGAQIRQILGSQFGQNYGEIERLIASQTSHASGFLLGQKVW